jgi:hypothetical protein
MKKASAVSKTKFSKIKPTHAVIALIILALIVLPSYYFYNQYKQSQMLLQNPADVITQQGKDLIDKVGKLIELPTGEEPTIYSVKDKTQLPNIPLFAKAQNGDQVLIYQKAQKGILYRPNENKIIEVLPIIISNTSPTPLPSNTFRVISPTPVPTITP